MYVACGVVVGSAGECKGKCGSGYLHVMRRVGSLGGTDPAYVGMAPGANVISLRVLGADGSGNVSTVIDAINWTIANKNKFQIRVINRRFGGSGPPRAGDSKVKPTGIYSHRKATIGSSLDALRVGR